jgi:transposase
MTREQVTLNSTEQQRAQVLSQILEGRLPVREAARLLGHSSRHIQRLLAKVRKWGPAALAHGNRGRASPRRTAETIRARVLALARGRYAGCNDCHFTDLLAEREAIHLSRPTVYRLRREAGLASPRTRRAPRHRRRRERMPQAGLLVQMDGSQHPWLEDRGPRLVLHAAIDDATSCVLAAVFRPEEDAHGYFLIIRQLIHRYGVPAAVYTDRAGLFRRDPRTRLPLPEQLSGAEPSTQVGRALHQLGITWIPAASAPAKGRVERLFGTFQDRLVVELRLAHARTMPQAQRVLDRFLPRYNARFARPAADATPAWRPAPQPQELERICCYRYRRTVGLDNTIRLDGQWVQLLPGPQGRSYAKTRVDVHAFLDGTLGVSYGGQPVPSRRLAQPPQPIKRRIAVAMTPRPPHTPYTPPPDHPWRRPFLTRPQPRDQG